MKSHSVTCHPTEVNAFRLNPSQISRYSIYLPRRDRRLSWLRLLVTYWDGLLACKQSPIQVLTRPGVEQLCWSDETRYRCATLPLWPKTYSVKGFKGFRRKKQAGIYTWIFSFPDFFLYMQTAWQQCSSVAFLRLLRSLNRLSGFS